jgi:hypothetical protein
VKHLGGIDQEQAMSIRFHAQVQTHTSACLVMPFIHVEAGGE